MTVDVTLFAALMSTTEPALPAADWMRLYLPFAWTVVLAGALVALPLRWTLGVQRVLCGLLALAAVLPGAFSPVYWLGLAFQAPSLTSVLVGLWCLRGVVTGGHIGLAGGDAKANGLWRWALPFALLGYGLLFDTLALLPWQMYAWGFSPALLLALLTLALMPWSLKQHTGVAVWAVPAALLLFAATRLPTGNVWDALMDPLLWILLQAMLIRLAYWHVRRRG